MVRLKESHSFDREVGHNVAMTNTAEPSSRPKSIRAQTPVSVWPDRSGYRGAVRVCGVDGVSWDVVAGWLAPSSRVGVPFEGELYPAVGAAIARWSGPVLLRAPWRDGSHAWRAVVTPVGFRKDSAVLSVTGLEGGPWTDWQDH